jgi:hypothetical protein
MLAKECLFPALAEPYDSALRAAVALILDRFDDLEMDVIYFVEWESDPEEVRP